AGRGRHLAPGAPRRSPLRQPGGVVEAALAGEELRGAVAPQPQRDLVGLRPAGADRRGGVEQRVAGGVEGQAVDEVLPPGQAEHGLAEAAVLVEQYEA